jgi:hypothetical protein
LKPRCCRRNSRETHEELWGTRGRACLERLNPTWPWSWLLFTPSEFMQMQPSNIWFRSVCFTLHVGVVGKLRILDSRERS